MRTGLSHLFSPTISSLCRFNQVSNLAWTTLPRMQCLYLISVSYLPTSLEIPKLQLHGTASEAPPPSLNECCFCRSIQLWPTFMCIILLIFETHFNPYSQALRWLSYHCCLLLHILCSPPPKCTACAALL